MVQVQERALWEEVQAAAHLAAGGLDEVMRAVVVAVTPLGRAIIAGAGCGKSGVRCGEGVGESGAQLCRHSTGWMPFVSHLGLSWQCGRVREPTHAAGASNAPGGSGDGGGGRGGRGGGGDGGSGTGGGG